MCYTLNTYGVTEGNDMKKKRRRKAQMIQRGIKIAAAAAVIVLAVIVIRALAAHLPAGKSEETVAEDGTVLAEIDTSQITHLSFAVLSIEESESRMSVSQFEEALQELYDDGYCLLDVYSIAETDEEGNYSYPDTILFPEGKKPLILSQRDVCYPFDASAQGTAEKMLLSDGAITCQYTTSDYRQLTGDYDVVPIVESFIKKHPDFSYNGARGILSFSGYCGILGYRTSSYLAGTDNNPYAETYGTFDTASEQQQAQAVLAQLQELGWHFAGAGYAQGMSYGSEYSIVEADVQSWADEVGSLLGDTDLLIFPMQTDIDSWKGYSEDNAKYTLLKENGFSWFFINMQSTPRLLQIQSGYVRQTTYEVNTYSDLQTFIQ